MGFPYDVIQGMHLKNAIDVPLNTTTKARAKQLKDMNLLTSDGQLLLKHNVKDISDLSQNVEDIILSIYVTRSSITKVKVAKGKRRLHVFKNGSQ